MKTLLTGLLALFVFAPAARAEVIDAVLFNPSRLGRYENLKVSSELDASGGVNVQTATVQSHSAVNVNSPSGYNLENVSAHKVNLPNTAFQATSFQAAGGKASFGSGEIQKLRDSAQRMIRVKGKTVTVSGDVTVEMLGGEDSSNQEVRGLKLGGNDIPRPASGCVELGWYAQKAASGKEYKVLGFKSCPGGDDEEECTKTCPSGYTLNEEKCECEKENLCDDCSCAAYLKNNKAECCPLVDDPEASLGADWCYIRKYLWGPKETLSLSGSAQIAYNASNGESRSDGSYSNCGYPSEEVMPDGISGSFSGVCPTEEGQECTHDGYICLFKVRELFSEFLCSGVQKGNMCHCWVQKWPGRRCEETFVRNGW